MIQKLRNPYVMKWGLKAILIVTIPAFVLFYGFSGKSGGPVNTGPLVTLQTDEGAVKLDSYQLSQIKEDAVQYYLRLGVLSGQIPQDQAGAVRGMIDNGINPMEVAEFAMGEVALEQRLEREGFRVTDKQAVMALKDRGVTKQDIQSSGYSQAQIAAMEKRSIQNRLAEGSVQRIARTSMLELWNEYQLSNEILTTEMVSISIPFQSEMEVTDKEIQERYDELVEKQDQLVIDPEKRVYDFVKIPAPKLEVPEPTEEQLKAAYDESDEDDPELIIEAGPRIRHIDVTINDAMGDKAIAEAKANIEKAHEMLSSTPPAPFGEAAALIVGSDSPDAMAAKNITGYWYNLPETGDMGDEWVEYIETAELNQPSDVIETPQGLSIVEVLERREGGRMSFEEAKPVLRKRVRKELAEVANDERDLKIEDNVERLSELAVSQTTLSGIARELKVDVQRTSPTAVMSKYIDGIGNLTRDFEAIEFLDPNQISEVVQPTIGGDELKGDVAVVSIVEEIDERVKTLDEVADQIKRNIQREKEVEKATAKIESIQVAEGESFTSATMKVDDTLTVKQLDPFARQPGRQAPRELGMVQGLDMELVRAKAGDIVVLKSGYMQFVQQVIGLYIKEVEAPTIAEFMNAIKEEGLEIQYIMAKRQGYLEEYRRDAQRVLKAEISDVLKPSESEE